MLVFRGGTVSPLISVVFQVEEKRLQKSRKIVQQPNVIHFFLFGTWGGGTEIPFGSSDTDRYFDPDNHDRLPLQI